MLNPQKLGTSLFFLIAALSGIACSTPQTQSNSEARSSCFAQAEEAAKSGPAAASERQRKHFKFNQFQSLCGASIWSDDLSPITQAALAEYQSRKNLDNGLVYGDSVRNLDLSQNNLTDIDRALLGLRCTQKKDWIREPKRNTPIRDSKGRKLPMIIYLCPDGGVVRVKPAYDSSNKFIPQPHAVKSLRYPADSAFESFNDEALKIDNEGNPIPKWPKDMTRFFADDAKQKELMDGWAEDAHTDLK